jgi:hypothetical protein
MKEAVKLSYRILELEWGNTPLVINVFIIFQQVIKILCTVFVMQKMENVLHLEVLIKLSLFGHQSLKVC